MTRKKHFLKYIKGTVKMHEYCDVVHAVFTCRMVYDLYLRSRHVQLSACHGHVLQSSVRCGCEAM